VALLRWGKRWAPESILSRWKKRGIGKEGEAPSRVQEVLSFGEVCDDRGFGKGALPPFLRFGYFKGCRGELPALNLRSLAGRRSRASRLNHSATPA